MNRTSGMTIATALLLTRCLAQVGPPLQCVDSLVPQSITICGSSYGEATRVGGFTVVGPAGESGVKFKFDRMEHLSGGAGRYSNYLLVTPSSRTTPGFVQIGPNPNVIRTMRPDRYSAILYFTTVDESPPRTFGGGRFVVLNLTGPPPQKIDAVVNSASLSGSISPGTLISISGSNLGPPAFSSMYDSVGSYPVEWGNTTVFFNGVAARLLYVSPSRIDAVVPYALAGQATADVVVAYFWVGPGSSQTSPPFSISLANTAPAIFTASPNGSGQGSFIHYPSNSYNSADNPAPPGSGITLFATGEGMWDDSVQAGTITQTARNFVTKPVSLTVGGQPARIQYAGAAPYQVGKLQINALLPEGIASGQQPVVLKIGDADNARQGVTISIR